MKCSKAGFAILGANFLSVEESLEFAVRPAAQARFIRPNQNSYLLYPTPAAAIRGEEQYSRPSSSSIRRWSTNARR